MSGNKLNVKILTPEALFTSGKADSINFTLEDGGYEILPGHSAVVLSLADGFIEIKNGSTSNVIWSTSGIARISNNDVSVFVDYCAETKDKLTIGEKMHFDVMQREKQGIKEYAETKISLTRVITGVKKKKNRNM